MYLCQWTQATEPTLLTGVPDRLKVMWYKLNQTN